MSIAIALHAQGCKTWGFCLQIPLFLLPWWSLRNARVLCFAFLLRRALLDCPFRAVAMFRSLLPLRLSEYIPGLMIVRIYSWFVLHGTFGTFSNACLWRAFTGETIFVWKCWKAISVKTSEVNPKQTTSKQFQSPARMVDHLWNDVAFWSQENITRGDTFDHPPTTHPYSIWFGGFGRANWNCSWWENPHGVSTDANKSSEEKKESIIKRDLPNLTVSCRFVHFRFFNLCWCCIITLPVR